MAPSLPPSNNTRRIRRDGDTVLRPAGPFSASVQELLRRLRTAGFMEAPYPLGLSETEERVAFLPGRVVNPSLAPNERSLKMLCSAARLLRRYHDASSHCVAWAQTQTDWLLTQRSPAEVVCHGDFAPYNVIGREGVATGIIDFDTAHPGPRAWDIAYAVYRWVPLMHPSNPEGFCRRDQQLERLRCFCAAYGGPFEWLDALWPLVPERLLTLVDFMRSRASGGDARFEQNIADGHDRLYLQDVEYLIENSMDFRAQTEQLRSV